MDEHSDDKPEGRQDTCCKAQADDKSHGVFFCPLAEFPVRFREKFQMVETGGIIVAFLKFGLIKLAVGNDLCFHFYIKAGDVFFEAFIFGKQADRNEDEKRQTGIDEIPDS